MKHFINSTKTQSTALAVVLVFLVIGSGVAMLRAFAQTM